LLEILREGTLLATSADEADRRSVRWSGASGGPDDPSSGDGPPSNGGGAGSASVAGAPTVQWRTVLRRFTRHRLAMVALVILVLVTIASLVGGHLWRYSYRDRDLTQLSQGPSWAHPFGTDGIGKDTLAQVLRGSQKSVQLMLLVAFLSTTFGVVLGALAGWYRGWVDGVISRCVDVWLMFPTITVAAVLARRTQSTRSGLWAHVLHGPRGIALILAACAWMPVARVVRAELLALREREFVQAALAVGASDLRIMFRHLLPNVIGSVAVAATLTMSASILAETTLSYLGFGVRAPDTSLGLLVADGQQAAHTRPWLFYFPGLVIIVIVLCVNFIGEGVRDAFDPKHTRGRR
jgi:ABC-type dipeptide/oligopeptide/nickel transport system permease subunit